MAPVHEANFAISLHESAVLTSELPPSRPDTGNSGRAQARTWATAHERLRVECLQPLNVRFPAMRTPAFSKSTTAAHHPFEPFGMRNRGQQLVACAGPLAAKESRSREVAREFQREHPCPSTGLTTGACPGYRKDHIKALACGDRSLRRAYGNCRAKPFQKRHNVLAYLVRFFEDHVVPAIGNASQPSLRTFCGDVESVLRDGHFILQALNYEHRRSATLPPFVERCPIVDGNMCACHLRIEAAESQL